MIRNHLKNKRIIRMLKGKMKRKERIMKKNE